MLTNILLNNSISKLGSYLNVTKDQILPICKKKTKNQARQWQDSSLGGGIKVTYKKG